MIADHTTNLPHRDGKREQANRSGHPQHRQGWSLNVPPAPVYRSHGITWEPLAIVWKYFGSGLATHVCAACGAYVLLPSVEYRVNSGAVYQMSARDWARKTGAEMKPVSHGCPVVTP